MPPGETTLTRIGAKSTEAARAKASRVPWSVVQTPAPRAGVRALEPEIRVTDP
jgi:hypothetical protein